MKPRFLEPDVVLFLHDQALREYGGIHGIRSEDLLHSVLGRPLDRLSHDDQGNVDLFDLAASYAYGLARNHAFNDGNKRIAWACCTLFLKANGCGMDVPVPEVLERIVLLASSLLDEPAFAGCLRRNRRS